MALLILQAMIVLLLGLMFVSAYKLRITRPDTPRPYKVPGEAIGMWILAGAGFPGSLAAFTFSFVPPAQIAVGSPLLFVLLVLLGTLFFVSPPMLIYVVRRPHWRRDDAAFEPFSWEKGA